MNMGFKKGYNKALSKVQELIDEEIKEVNKDQKECRDAEVYDADYNNFLSGNSVALFRLKEKVSKLGGGD